MELICAVCPINRSPDDIRVELIQNRNEILTSTQDGDVLEVDRRVNVLPDIDYDNRNKLAVCVMRIQTQGKRSCPLSKVIKQNLGLSVDLYDQENDSFQ